MCVCVGPQVLFIYPIDARLTVLYIIYFPQLVTWLTEYYQCPWCYYYLEKHWQSCISRWHETGIRNQLPV